MIGDIDRLSENRWRMKPIRMTEAYVCSVLDSPLSGSIMSLPHGAGSLRFEVLTLVPGVTLAVRRGFLKEPFALSGKDCDGIELAFHLGSERRVLLEDRLVFEHTEPVLTVYQGRGDQEFEIIEKPTRDATFVEFTFTHEALRELSVDLEQALLHLLSAGKSFGSARMHVQSLPPALSQAARRLALSSTNVPLQLTLLRDAFNLLYLFTTETFGAQPRSDDMIAVRAGEILRSNLANPPSVAELARIIDISVSRMLDVFQQYYNLSPSRFVRAERMRRAKERLQQDPVEVTVTQLAWELGYRSTSHFVQAFRHEYDVTPAAFSRNKPNI